METTAKTEMDTVELDSTKDFEGFIKPKKFVRDQFETFDVETCIEDNQEDAVVHFYPKPDSTFHNAFVPLLDKHAQQYFGATYPRIKAAYTPEMRSWWMQLNSFPVLDLRGYIHEFYLQLDAAIRAVPET